MGFGMVEEENMKDIEEDEEEIELGDLGRGYMVVERIGVRVMRDNY